MSESQIREKLTPCPGAGVTLSHSSPSVLCYCGRVFRRRFNSLKEVWQVPKHVKDISHENQRPEDQGSSVTSQDLMGSQ